MLPLGAITGRATKPIDVKEPVDIEMRPSDIGRYWGQGVHWRGRGADGLPDAANIARVAGPVSIENFLLHGASWYVKFERLAAALLPGGLAGRRRIVDWGCGCARIARHAPPEAIAENLETGFVDHGWQQDVGVDVHCPGACVQVSHGLGYVQSKCSQLFEIVDWIDGFADLQTLVIVR